jgi:hypothetical protein
MPGALLGSLRPDNTGHVELNGENSEYAVSMRYACRIAVAIVLLTVPCLTRAQAQGLVQESLRISTREAGSRGPEAIVVRPDDELAHPLALLTHGTPREADKRGEITADRQQLAARLQFIG